MAISPINQILNNIEEVQLSSNKYLNSDFNIVVDPKQKATSHQLGLRLVQLITGQPLSNTEKNKLQRVDRQLEKLYSDWYPNPISRVFFSLRRMDLYSYGHRIPILRESLSLLSVMKDNLKMMFHDHQLQWQSVPLETRRMKMSFKMVKGGGRDLFFIKISDIAHVAYVYKYYKYWDLKQKTLRTDLSAVEFQELAAELSHSDLDPSVANLIQYQLLSMKANRAVAYVNSFNQRVGRPFGGSDGIRTLVERVDFQTIFPPYVDLVKATTGIAYSGTEWTVDELEIIKSQLKKLQERIDELDALYIAHYLELQFILNNYFRALPETSKILLKNRFPLLSDIQSGVAISPFPTPAKFAENFFNYALYAKVDLEQIADCRVYDLPLSDQIIETFPEQSERKGNETDEKAIKVAAAPSKKRRASFEDQTWHQLLEAHRAQFPKGISYAERVEDWFSRLDQKPLETLQDKGNALKHRLPKLLDSLIGTAYSRRGVFEKNGRQHESWYLAMRLTALGKTFDGVLALTFDEHGAVYHRCFEKEAQGDGLINEILPWLIKDTQSPTPLDVKKMDKKREETRGSSLSDKAPAPKGIVIEPHFGTLTLQYEDSEILYNGSAAQVKIDLFRPGK